jgi:hypothetical protein
MNVREQVQHAEHTIQKAIVEACKELEAQTGLLPKSIEVRILETGTHINPYDTMVGSVKIRLGL